MHFGRNSILMVAGVTLIALGLAACGGSDDSNGSSASGMGASSSGETVATESVPGLGNALLDSTGMVLYTNDMDTGSKIACTDRCLTEWLPLAAPSAGQPTSDDSAVQAKLGTMQRPEARAR
jgi:predicted lipoprotein with Yx(FWY)xxD motif